MRHSSKEHLPATVLVVDLMEHSTRPPHEVEIIQKKVEASFQHAVRELNLNRTHFNYTGDGYVVALTADDCARSVDFIADATNRLRASLKPLDQPFRMGVDVGIIRLQPNVLTKTIEHFDEAGIRAARLESAAQPDQILATTRFTDIFATFLSDDSTGEPQILRVKKHEIEARELRLDTGHGLRELMLEFLTHEHAAGDQGDDGTEIIDMISSIMLSKILVVDDDSSTRELVARLLLRTGAEVLHATNAMEGLDIATSHTLDLIITDVVMPNDSGFKMLHRIRQEGISTPAIVMSGYTSAVVKQHLEMVEDTVFQVFLQKPFKSKDLYAAVEALCHDPFLRELQKNVPDADGTFMLLFSCRALAGDLLRYFTSGDMMDTAFRHKVKECLYSFANNARSGESLAPDARILFQQLKKMSQLRDVFTRSQDANVVQYLESFAADMQDDHPGIDIDMRVAPELAEIKLGASISKLLLIVGIELIDNARAALGESGAISVDISSRRAEPFIALKVWNSGVIPPEVGNRIFEEGVTTKGEGRGSGLPLVKRLLEKFGGSIRLIDEEGITFLAKFPIKTAD